MNLNEQKDLKEALWRETELRNKLKEVYPEKEFGDDIFSPQTGIWLSQQVIPLDRLETIGAKCPECEVVKALKQRIEAMRLWHECYLCQNS